MNYKSKKIEEVLEESFRTESNDSVQPLNEAENPAGKTTEEVFGLLDEARKALQDAQANIYIKMPNMYQQAYKAELDSIYNHCGQAIAEIQVLAKKVHTETGQ